MNFVLTIDNQPLVLKLEAILALFGKSRTMEFAEGKWTPFVLFQVEDEPNSVTVVQRIDFTGLNKSEIESSLGRLPPDVRDFPGFVRDAIEKIEQAQLAKPDRQRCTLRRLWCPPVIFDELGELVVPMLVLRSNPRCHPSSPLPRPTASAVLETPHSIDPRKRPQRIQPRTAKPAFGRPCPPHALLHRALIPIPAFSY